MTGPRPGVPRGALGCWNTFLPFPPLAGAGPWSTRAQALRRVMGEPFPVPWGPQPRATSCNWPPGARAHQGAGGSMGGPGEGLGSTVCPWPCGSSPPLCVWWGSLDSALTTRDGLGPSVTPRQNRHGHWTAWGHSSLSAAPSRPHCHPQFTDEDRGPESGGVLPKDARWC